MDSQNDAIIIIMWSFLPPHTQEEKKYFTWKLFTPGGIEPKRSLNPLLSLNWSFRQVLFSPEESRSRRRIFPLMYFPFYGGDVLLDSHAWLSTRRSEEVWNGLARSINRFRGRTRKKKHLNIELLLFSQIRAMMDSLEKNVFVVLAWRMLLTDLRTPALY